MYVHQKYLKVSKNRILLNMILIKVIETYKTRLLVTNPIIQKSEKFQKNNIEYHMPIFGSVFRHLT